MASLGHIAVGVLAAEILRALRRRDSAGPASEQNAPAFFLRDAFRFSALALLPDADVLAFGFGIPYEHDFGHRGASHSLAFAILVALLAFTILRFARDPRPAPTALLVALVVASHGPLDMLTDGGLGVALLWPFDSSRYFFPWTPIPVSPIGPGLFSQRGLYVLLIELMYFAPPVAAFFWVSRPRNA